ncbi:MAG: hypothetical protein GJU73_01415 [Ferrovum sp.]|jgi:hypothetical protein|uniref:hypothetical protein n=1 Tax=Ferrovum sp. TaxID=2609467 RepID=UPI0026234F35|nr:hypothetical protein [Ferrovum sp.]MBW8066077.1 hypothetical protein [Ferrovum sp.]
MKSKFSIRAAARAWGKQIRSFEAWCGFVFAIVFVFCAGVAVLGLSALVLSSDPPVGIAIALKFALMAGFILLPTCGLLTSFFEKLGKDFVAAIPKLSLLFLSSSELLYNTKTDNFTSRIISLPAEPPRQLARVNLKDMTKDKLFSSNSGRSFGAV